MSIKLVAFDLDGTLAPSRGPISLEMADALESLLNVAQVCIITGGNKKQIVSQVVSRLSKSSDLKNLSIMPTSGASYLKKTKFGWKLVYSLKLTKKQVRRIKKVIKVVSKKLGYWPKEPYGKVIEDRICQVTFSALGQKALAHEKSNWDKSGKKKNQLKTMISLHLPGFEVRSGGSTSIDVTKSGIDKGFAVKKLIRLNNLNTSEIVFVGDRFDSDGNDFPVLKTKVKCIEVKNPWQTIGVIRDLLKHL